MTKIYMVANGGYDYDGFDILQLCSTKEIAESYLKDYNNKETTSKVMPWNARGILEIELDIPFEEQTEEDE